MIVGHSQSFDKEGILGMWLQVIDNITNIASGRDFHVPANVVEKIKSITLRSLHNNNTYLS